MYEFSFHTNKNTAGIIPVHGIHVRERIRVKMRILLVWQNYADQKKHSDIDAFRKMQ